MSSPTYLQYGKESVKRLIKNLEKRGIKEVKELWEYSKTFNHVVLNVIYYKEKRIELFKLVRDKKIEYISKYKKKNIKEILKEIEE